MKLKDMLTEKRILFFSLFLGLIILSLIPVVRYLFFDSSLSGTEPYYHLRISEYIKEKGIPDKDPLVDRNYLPDPYDLFLSLTGYFIDINLASFIIPILLGIISIIFSYLILKELRLNPLKRLLILFIFLISPVFIYTYSISNSDTLGLTLLLIGFYLFIKKDNVFSYLSLIFFIIFSLFSPVNAIIIIFLLFSYSLNHKSKIKQSYIYSIITILVAIAYFIKFYMRSGLPDQIIFSHQNMLINFLSDLGGITGFGIFNIFLTFIGLYVIWNIKKQVLPYIFLLILIIISLSNSSINIYLNIFICFISGFGFFRIINMKWKIKIIKTLTIMVIIYGLFFSSLSYIKTASNLLPDNETTQSLEWLRPQPKGIVFSHYTNGFWIETIADQPVLLDQGLYNIVDASEKLNESEEIFYSRNLEKTISLLKKNNITYIYIDDSMKKGKVWDKPEQGLLFLFRNQKTFKNIYSSESVDIWQVLLE